MTIQDSHLEQISRISALAAAKKRFLELAEREECEESLMKFLEKGWQFIDPAPFQSGWHLDAIAEHLQAVTDGHIRRLIINVPPRSSKSSLVSVAWPAWTWAQSQIGPLSGPQVQFLSTSYSHTLSLRDSVKTRRIIGSKWYKSHWGDRFYLTGDVNTKGRFENNKGGYRLATSVDGTTTGEGGNIILVDDAHSATEVESDTVRQNTLIWWDETMQTRLNNQETDAFVIIMQRLHEDDLTGHILSHDAENWTLLMLPMEYEPDRHCITYVDGQKFWEDPRTEDGELLCQGRFSAHAVETLKKSLGPFGCTPAESPVLMADLTMRPIGEIKAGDEVVGFTTDTNDAKKRRNLKTTKVIEVFQYVAPVVKITLDSGEVVRCTRDHKWYMGKNGGNRGWFRDGRQDVRPLYRKAELGRKLMRVCPPAIPRLTKEQERSAGWLAGFFDGEGSASNCEKRGQKRHGGETYRPSIAITFHQTAERNLPICQKLERILKEFGFDYSLIEGKRKNGQEHWQIRRQYTLRGISLPLCQKFLHMIGPTKWRDRIRDGALGAHFIISQESVVSIEPDGEEPVFALKTETGNYIVWGLASSNSSGQLQQSPSPRGGGIIKREYWKLWEDDKPFPPFEYLIGSLDTAYTSKEENDQSALTIWGVFRDENRNPRVMLVWAWASHLEFPELCTFLVDHLTVDSRSIKDEDGNSIPRFPIHTLVIEAKAAGFPVGQELYRIVGQQGKFGIFFPNQARGKYTQDKVARVYSIQHIFADGMVYAPRKKWADDLVISQCEKFPKGSRDDLVDTTSMALRYLRDIGLLMRREEQAIDEAEEMRYRSREEPLYPV